MTPKERLDKLNDTFGEITKGLATSKEVAEAIVPILKELRAQQSSIKAVLEKDNLKDKDIDNLKGQLKNVSDTISNLKKEHGDLFSKIWMAFSKVKTLKGDRGEKGDKGDSIRGDAGKDGSPDTAEDIRNKLELLEGEERLNAKYIDGVITQEGLDFAIGVLDKRTQYLINKVVTSSTGSGTVTGISIASTNGLAGTSDGNPATPTITLATTVTGLLKGNGTSITAATGDTDYQNPITLTTTGTSGAATFTGDTLNIPQYAGSGGSGTVTSVTSANADIGVANTTTTPVLTLNSGTGNNQIVKLDSSARLPAVDGSQLTNLPSGFTNPMTTLGDIIYEDATPTAVRLAGNTTSTKKFLRQTGTGSISAVPAWDTIVAGDVPTLNQNTTGSAATLTTPRAINGVNFDGSAAITVPAAAGTLTGTTLATNVVTSSLTAVGTLITGVWNATKIGLAFGGTNADLSATGGTSQVLKQVSAGAAITVGQLAASDLSNGTTGTGAVVLSGSPTITTAALGSSTATTQAPSDNSTKIATTGYVDAAVLGQNFKEAALVATTTNLVGVYVAGVFTYTATGTDNIDGVNLALGNRVLVKNQTTTFQNGIYSVTTAGSLGVAGVLTRTSDANMSSEFKTGDSIFITSGTANANTTWAYTGSDSPNIGTDAITYAQTAGQGTVTAGNGIAITGLSVAIDTSITVDKTTAQTLTNKTLTAPVLGGTVTGTYTIGGTPTFPSNVSLLGNTVTGTGSVVLATSPTLVTPALGTPSALVGTNITGTAAGLTAGTVTTNANLTGAVTSTGNATILGSFSSANLSGALTDETGSGSAVFGTTPTITTPVLNGTPTGTGVATASTASTLALRDANKNLTANNHIEGYTTTATSGTTVTLTVGSTHLQFFTGSTAQTVALPVASTMVLGQQFLIVNQSSAAVTIQSSGGNTVLVLAGSTIAGATSALITCILASGTGSGSWETEYYGLITTSGKVLSATNSLILSGSDGTTMTFPGTSATIARTDTAQTFTGTQVFSQIVTTINAITATSNAATVPVTSRISNVTNSSAATLTITMTTTGAVDGQMVIVRVFDFSGVAQTITWVNTENSTVTVPTTSNGSTSLPLTVGFQFNNATTKWRCLASA